MGLLVLVASFSSQNSDMTFDLHVAISSGFISSPGCDSLAKKSRATLPCATSAFLLQLSAPEERLRLGLLYGQVEYA